MVVPYVVGGASLLGSLWGRFNPTVRKLKKMEHNYEKARQYAALAGIKDEQRFRKEEDPRERALLKQSLFGRGLGKSSIYDQDMARLTKAQARQRAALKRQKGIVYGGLSLIRQRRKYERRMLPMQIWGDIQGAASSAAPFLGGMS